MLPKYISAGISKMGLLYYYHLLNSDFVVLRGETYIH